MLSYMNTVQVCCYNCKSTNSSLYAEENGYKLVKCSQCGLLYVNPRPGNDEMSQATMSGLHKGVKIINVTEGFKPYKVKHYLSILSDLYRTDMPTDKINWMDIGCGNGEFLLALSKYFTHKVDAKGIEPNVHKQQIALGKGLKVGFYDLQTSNEKYDTISILNVYSHLPDPVEAFTNWYNLLNPGGELIIETGDSAHLTYSEHHKPFYLPDHLSFANEEIITSILNRTGYKVIELKKYRYHMGFPATVKDTILYLLGKNKYLFSTYTKRPSNMWIRARKIAIPK
jgi:SAM-dependent methyltransferase